MTEQFSHVAVSSSNYCLEIFLIVIKRTKEKSKSIREQIKTFLIRNVLQTYCFIHRSISRKKVLIAILDCIEVDFRNVKCRWIIERKFSTKFNEDLEPYGFKATDVASKWFSGSTLWQQNKEKKQTVGQQNKEKKQTVGQQNKETKCGQQNKETNTLTTKQRKETKCWTTRQRKETNSWATRQRNKIEC